MNIKRTDEKLIKDIEEWNKQEKCTVDDGRTELEKSQEKTIQSLIEENQRLKENNQSMQVEIARSWERIDKAIEYVKSKKAIINTDYIRIFDLFEIDEQGYTDELLNILKGENND